jgi:lipopolysaccharide export system permease protein
VRLLSRYLLRQLVAPFVFGLAALTSLFLLSQIAKKFGSLVGKGLPWGVIAEVFALSLPFIVALTMPMAVLLAVLYAFSHLAADNEITAMRASGISVYQVLAPVLGWGIAMSLLSFAFVDQVVPRTNARLRALQLDIARKKPTLELREQVINEMPPSQYFLRAGRIDGPTGRMKDITIYDMGGETSRRIIYADSGQMAYTRRPGRDIGGLDLNLRLYDGSIHQYRPSDPLSFQLTYYRVNDIRVRDVYDSLVRNDGDAVRGDREMSTCEMLSVIRDARTDQRNAERDREELLQSDLRTLLHLPPLPPRPPDTTTGRLPAYCAWIDRLQMVFSRTAEPQSPAQPPSGEVRRATISPEELPARLQEQAASVPVEQPEGQKPAAQKSAAERARILKPPIPGPAARVAAPPVRPPTQGVPPATRPAARVPPAASAPARLPRPLPTKELRSKPQQPPKPIGPAGSPPPLAFPKPVSGQPRLSNWAQVATTADRVREADRRADRFAVEVHKKWSISFACISFVIIGIVMAVRFPRGGIGLVIGGGLLIFAIHYVGLTAGESLADRGYVSPWEAMWAPNIVLTIVGLIGLYRLRRESGSTRGGDFQEVLDGVRHLVRRVRRRAPPPAEAA